MERSMRRVLLLSLLTIATITISIGSCNGNLGVLCKGSEKEALLRFRQDLKDPANRLLSWGGGGDCCKWTGVVCDNLTGHILELHLSKPDNWVDIYPTLGGKINPSLLSLKHLNYLDLSKNDFQGIQIPTFFGSLKSLRYLNLSSAGFEGTIPHQLGNLSSLRDLRLDNYNVFTKVESLQWISGLSQLEHLDMSCVNLSKASDHWLQVTNMLPSLVELHLSRCGLDNIPPLPITNFTSLAILDLSLNSFNSLIPRWFFSLRNLASLDLSGCGFQGPIPGSPHNITSLREIDLAQNSLTLPIPEWLFNHKDLTLLSLGYNQFGGPFPGGIVNMTSLKVLHLESNNFRSSIPKWLYSLSNLEFISLSYNKLDGEILSDIGNLTSLAELLLDDNLLEGKIPNTLGYLRELVDLDLSNNNFNGNVSELFESSHQIDSLSLRHNNFSGHLTEQIGKCKNLSYLDLSFNSISGPIPVSLGNLLSLRNLDISHNQFNGTLPETIGQLKLLTELEISYNSLEGVVSEAHFTGLASLEFFNANANSLTLKTHRGWFPPFSLQRLVLDSWQMGPEFPVWLQRQTRLQFLSLSDTGISATIPTWFWNFSSQLYYMNLSHNQLYGEIQNIVAAEGSIVDLGSNQFNGSLPLVSSAVNLLDLSNSSFSGSVFHFFCDKINIPKQVSYLYLGNNLVSGNIPDCWMNWGLLQVLNLENNNLTGNIPSSMESLNLLQSLHLRNNGLSGELPPSLMYSMNMRVLDIGENKFVGRLPAAMIENGYSSLLVLNLRSNKLQGGIPDELCALSNLQILDLADNNLSGTIPRCVKNFSAMARLPRSDGSIELFNIVDYGKYLDKTFLVTKGREVEYSEILGLVTSMDLSNNIISGEIPEQLTSLFGLQTLNLSNNLLTGRIPSKIGNMVQLESLDLSKNQLFGEIPASMTSMTFLSRLNLSYNNLAGRIPESTQLQSLDQSSFVGNELCGAPLIKNCSASKVTPPTVEQHSGYDLLKDKWFYLSLGLGFAVGFWSILGSLLVNMPWSFAFSRFLNSIVLKLYDVIVEYV